MDGEHASPPSFQPSAPSRSRSSGTRSLKSLTRLLEDERESKEWKELIQKLHDQLQLERQRAEDAEHRVLEIASHLKSVNDSRLQALQDVARLNEELKLYEIQFDKAQKEIYRAQDVLKIVDDQRYRAEQDAAKARSTARKLKEELTIYEAREEGRRLGLQQGLRKGRELGYQEGRRMAEAERTRDRADWDSSQDSREHSPDPHTPDTPGPVESLTRTRPRSTAPSPRPSTVPSGGVLPSHSVQPVPPIPEEPENIRPRSVRTAGNASPQMPTPAPPPDNFIPQLDGDNRIRLPPAFEFSHPLRTPERQRSPTLPTMSENEEPRMIPPPVATSRRSQHYRPTSVASASTTLSQLDMVNEPHIGDSYTPMSVIPEVVSARGSPNPQGTSVRRQSSIGTQSSRAHMESFYTRPRAGSGSTMSYQPPPIIPSPDPRASVSTNSTTPQITVQPPTAPNPLSASVPGGHIHDPSRPVGTSYHQNDSEPFLPPMPETSPQPTDPMPLPGDLPVRSVYSKNLVDDTDQPPVIPHPDLYTNLEDDDAVSSGMGSMESLTTPPGDQNQHRKLFNYDGSGDVLDPGVAGESLSGGGGGQASGNSHWAGIARMAAREPIRPVVPSAVSGARSPSNTGRPLSRSTNRSGQ